MQLYSLTPKRDAVAQFFRVSHNRAARDGQASTKLTAPPALMVGCRQEVRAVAGIGDGDGFRGLDRLDLDVVGAGAQIIARMTERRDHACADASS